MNNEYFGKIKIYGKIIDLDIISKEDLKKIKQILDSRLLVLSQKYIEIYNQND